MVEFHTENLGTTITAVGSLLTTVLVGAICVPYVPHRGNTLKDLGFVTSTIFIPCMLFHHLATSFTPAAMMTSFMLPMATLLGTFIGFTVGYVFCNLFLDESTKQYYALALMFCTFQNAVVLPLSLIMSVYRAKRISWLDEEAYEQCVAYVFIYTVPVITMIWSIGNMIAKNGAAKLRAQEAEQAAREAGHTGVAPVVVASTFELKTFAKNILQSMWNPPFISTLMGMSIGLNPWLVEDFQEHFDVVWDSMKLLGAGTVPCVLIMLGGNLGSTALPKENKETNKEVENNSFVEKKFSRKGSVATSSSPPTVTGGSAQGGEQLIELDSPPEDVIEVRPRPITGDSPKGVSFRGVPSPPTTVVPATDELADSCTSIPNSSLVSSSFVDDGELVSASPVKSNNKNRESNNKRRGSVVKSSAETTPNSGTFPPLPPAETTDSPPGAIPSILGVPTQNFIHTNNTQQQQQGEEEGEGPVEVPKQEIKCHSKIGSPPYTDASTRSSASDEPTTRIAKLLHHFRILFDPCGIPLKILIAIPLVRLIIVPIVAISCFHFVLLPMGLLPPVKENRAMWFVLITEATSPSAININVLCTIHTYMPGTASKMIFYQYSMSVVTMVVWLMFTLWYIG